MINKSDEAKAKPLEAELTRYSRTRNPGGWINTRVAIADFYAGHALNLLPNQNPYADKAIQYFEEGLEVLTESFNADVFLDVNAKLGRLYLMRMAGNRNENLIKATKSCKIALRLLPAHDKSERRAFYWFIAATYGHDDYVDRNVPAIRDLVIRNEIAALQLSSKTTEPEEWGLSQLNVGTAYARRVSGNKLGNQKVAIKHLTSSLEVNTKNTNSIRWMTAHRQLGLIYQSRIIQTPDANTGTQSAVVEKCIFHNEKTMEVLSKVTKPITWMATATGLLGAYQFRTAGNTSDTIEKYIKYGNGLLDLFSSSEALMKRTTPEMRSNWQFSLAQQYIRREVGSKADNLEKAVKHLNLALKNYSPTFMSDHFARAHSELSFIFRDEHKAGNRSDNLTTAIKHLNTALQIHTERQSPDDWAGVHTDIGMIYQSRPRGEKMAIEHLSKVVESKHASAYRRGEALMGLGGVYYNGVEGMSVEDGVEKAIEVYTRYLDVADKEDKNWTEVHYLLGMALGDRTKGDRNGNMERSMEHYAMSMSMDDSSLEDVFPVLMRFIKTSHTKVDGAGKSEGAGNAKGESTVDTAPATAAAETPPKDSDPTAWAAKQVDLADECLNLSDLKLRRESVEKAIGYYNSGLEVYTKRKFPQKWADVQMKLCEVYLQRVEGVRRVNLENAVRCFEACKEVRPEEKLPNVKKEWEKGADARWAAERAATGKKERVKLVSGNRTYTRHHIE